ncbi:hypothetical protein [Azospirillum sp. SYSU D00513]|uniref:hypothetical protein n=1 Tax=Azospirillum sp. SYSU D00513 TaxID=2812561 RepID=UPI001A96AE3A|nr:hypothetical protein [Azospirillum sp. SYSU D00513]
MSRIRTVKPDFWTSEQVVSCTFMARLLFIGLWNFCDDSGVHSDSPMRIKMEVFPADDIAAAEVAGLVDELVGAGLLERYSVGAASYLRVTGWKKHQKIDKPHYRHPLPNGETPPMPSRVNGGNSTNGSRPVPDHSKTVRRTLDDRSPAEWKGVPSQGECVLSKEGTYQGEGGDLTHREGRADRGAVVLHAAGGPARFFDRTGASATARGSRAGLGASSQSAAPNSAGGRLQ